MRGKVCSKLVIVLALALLAGPSAARVCARGQSGWQGLTGTILAAAMGRVKLDRNSVSASRFGQSITLHLPMENSGTIPRTAEYRVALFNLDGKRLAYKRGKALVGKGNSTMGVTLELDGLAKGHAAEANYVASYRVEVSDEVYRGKRSLFHLITKPSVSMRLPEQAFAGLPLTVPVLLTDALRGSALTGQTVDVAVTDESGRTHSVTARTNGHGTATVTLAGLPTGRARVTATGGLAGQMADSVAGEVEVVSGTRIHLSTDKPLYQPGQTMHLRALILARPDNAPAKDEDVLFEISDARGNKVFKEVSRTNAFGIVATTFALASKVNMGNYKILLTAGDNQTQKSVKVDRYVLPKFKLDLLLDREFYRPGGTMEGTVQARYFFGKPAGLAHVKATILDYQGQWVADREIAGEANEEGIFHFTYELPKRLVGQPVENGEAMMMVNVEVTDSAGQTQTTNRQVVVAAQPIQAYLIPESGSVVPGVRNNFFVAVTDPGGSPLRGESTLHFTTDSGHERTRRVTIDSAGLGTTSFTPPAGTSNISARMSFEGPDDIVGEENFELPVTGGEAAVLLRTNRSIISAGESLTVDVLTSNTISDAFLDVTRDGQTLLTRTITLSNGRGKAKIAIDPAISGTLALSVFAISARGEFTRDAQAVFVHPANDLKVKAVLDKESYLPGESARIQFQVADDNGPRQAALGIHIVDEALFALSESQPGLLKLFFALEEELLKPTYQIGQGSGATLGNLLQQPAASTSDARVQRDRSAQAAIAAQGDVAVSRQAPNSFAGTRDEVRAILDGHAQQLRQKLVDAARTGGRCQLNDGTKSEFSKVAARFRRDSWGRSYRKVANASEVKLHSAGPDRHFDTWDDVHAQVQAWESCDYPSRVERGGWGGARWGDAQVPTAMVAGAIGLKAEMDGAGRPVEKRPTALKRTAEEKRDKNKQRGASKGNAEVRVRKWFPETLFVENALLTDSEGRATIDVPLADSITTWRMSTVASDRSGQIGGLSAPVRVFQDFFVDIEFPTHLTRNDRIEFPVVVYNYLEESQTVKLELKAADWYELDGAGEAELKLAAGEVASVYFPVRISGVGWRALTVFGHGSAGFSDAVQRRVEVRADGERVERSAGGRLRTDDDGSGQATVELPYPASSIPGSRSLTIQVLPGLSSHVVQGMDSLLRLPGGCFEQTTSSAWPNVLALKYLKETEQSTPEIEMKAAQYVSAGYQRILTFECGSGGFNWWQGDATGNVVLSALGIMQLADAAKVHSAVDRKVIERAFSFLKQRQRADGSWEQDIHLHAGNENLGRGDLRTSCYIAWALQEGGLGQDEVAIRAVKFIEGKLPDEKDLYTVGMCANALARADRQGAVLDQALERIIKAVTVEGEFAYWTMAGQTLVNSGGEAGKVEATALMALALIHAGQEQQMIASVVNWLASKKDPQGNWGYNTQATVLALKVFLAAATIDTSDTAADVVVKVGDRELGRRHFDNFNKEVVWQLEAPADVLTDDTRLELVFEGSGNLGYQAVAVHHIPSTVDPQPVEGPLSIDVAYDRSQIRTNDTVRVRATFTRNDSAAEGAILATLGLPPGFELLTEDLEGPKREKVIRSYETTGRSLILYLDSLPVGKSVSLSYRLRARYPVRVQTGPSEVRLYYDNQVISRQDSEALEVK
jgi:alpha-2-macroglobulin-like protein